MTKTSKSAAYVKTAPDHIIEFAIFDTPGFGPVPIIIRPEDDAWSDTVKKLAELQVNKWRSSYCNPEIMDGQGWYLTVRSPELKKKSSGDNDYPPNFDEVRKVIETTQMALEEKINQLVLEILQQLNEPAIYLYLDKCLANDGDPDGPSEGVLEHYYDEGTPYVVTKGAGSKLSIKLNAWGPNYQKMTGVTFADNFDVPLEGIADLQYLEFFGKIEDGLGKRILFEALGDRTFTCRAEFPYDVFEPEILSDEGAAFTFTRRHIEIDFQSDTDEELQNIFAKLKAAKAEVEKYMTLSTLKEDYSPFRSWA